MFRSASLFIGTYFTAAVFTIFATSNVDSIVGIPHKIYSMQRILIHIIETVSPEGTFCDTVQVPSRGGDMELIFD